METLTITLTLEDWEDILNEAKGHLSYWGVTCESVDKLNEAIQKAKEETK